MANGIFSNLRSLRMGFRKLTIPRITQQKVKSSSHDSIDFMLTGAGSLATPTIFERLFSQVKDNSSSLINLVAVILVLVVEITFRSAWFSCPCTHPDNVMYGIMFILAPAVALFVLAFLASNVTWIIVTGCWRRSPEGSLGYRAGCFYCTGLWTRAALGPLAWIIFSLLDGKFYECAASLDPCSDDPHDLAANRRLRTNAQVAGCFLLLLSVILSCIALVCWRCFSRMTYEQRNYMETYRNIERTEIQKQFEEHALLVARENILAFLEKETEKQDWDQIAMVPGMEARFKERHSTKAYSALHKYISDEEREEQKSAAKALNSDKSVKAGSTPPLKVALVSAPRQKDTELPLIDSDHEEDHDVGDDKP